MGKFLMVLLGIVAYFLFSWIFRSIAYSIVVEIGIIEWLEYIIPTIVTFSLYIIIRNQGLEHYDFTEIALILGVTCFAGMFLPYSLGFGILFNLIMIGTIIYSALTNKYYYQEINNDFSAKGAIQKDTNKEAIRANSNTHIKTKKSIHSQHEIDMSYKNIHIKISENERHIDQYGLKLDYPFRIKLDQLEESILEYYSLIDKYDNTNKFVVFEGKKISYIDVDSILSELIKELAQKTRYSFSKLKYSNIRTFASSQSNRFSKNTLIQLSSSNKTPITAQTVIKQTDNMNTKTPQQMVQESGNKVFNSFSKLCDILDSNGGRLDAQTKTEALTVDSLIEEFHRLCNLYNSSVKMIMWDKTLQPLAMVVMMLNSFMRDVTSVTGYVFECKKKI